MHDLSTELQIELVMRMALAVLAGSVLGWERQMGRHPAGLRTHMLVSLGAAAYTIAGTYGVSGFGTVQDAGRVAAQIVTGVGFLGAGTIWRTSGDGGVIRGLTTAASIWVAAAIGMLAGFGLYWLAGGTAVLSFVVLRLIKGAERAPVAVAQLAARPFRSRRPAVAAAGSTFAPAFAATREVDSRSGDADPASGEPLAADGLPAGAGARAGGEPAVSPDRRGGKRKRLRKKDRKRKKRDLPTEQMDEISDEPAPDGVD